MSIDEKIEFYKKRQFGEKLNMIFVFLRQNAWPFVKAQVFITGPLLLLVNILVAKSSMSFLSFDFINGDPEEMLPELLTLYGNVFLVSMVTGTLMPLVTYTYMKLYHEKGLGQFEIGHILSRVIRKLPMVLIYNILTSLLVVIGMFFFILPGIYLAVVLSLGSAIIIFEDKDLFSAFGRAFKLIKDKWFSTFGLLVVTVIISMIINAVFGLPQVIIFGIWTFNSLDATTGTLDMSDVPSYMQTVNVIFAILSTFGTLISYSVIYLGLGFQYFNLVERQEARGLMAQIEGLESPHRRERERNVAHRVQVADRHASRVNIPPIARERRRVRPEEKRRVGKFVHGYGLRRQRSQRRKLRN